MYTIKKKKAIIQIAKYWSNDLCRKELRGNSSTEEIA